MLLCALLTWYDWAERESPMSIEISREIETRLTEEAEKLGISVDTLLARLVGGHAGPAPTRPKPELPAWNLGAGALHRRDIYDDAR